MGTKSAFVAPVPNASTRGHRASIRVSPGVLRLLAAVVVAVLGFLYILPAAAQDDSTLSPRQQLADRYAPIALLKEQPSECSSIGEPYLPIPVESVLGTLDVQLKVSDPDSEFDRVVAAGPTAQDLAGADDRHYLDLPGHPLQPGCDYERFSRARIAELGLEPSTYAHIATEEGVEGLALQYWFWYVYNDFNNLHEGDWEMIQLTWDVSTVEEALERDPASIAYAQHGGAERADWDDDKLRREGTQLLIYPSAGSHATHYGDAIWIGWAANAGVGCDHSDPPSVRTPLNVILVPETIDPDGEFAWLLFEGRWGERLAWEFNGPASPNTGTKWNRPVSWVQDLRDSSVAMPQSEWIGPGPAQVFCAMTSLGGRMAAEIPQLGDQIMAAVIAALIAPIVLASLAWRYVARAVRVYSRHSFLFLGAAITVLIVSILGGLVNRVAEETRIGSALLEYAGEPSIPQFVLGIGLGGIQHFLLIVLVGPAVIQLTYGLTRNDPTSLRQSWRIALRRLPTTIAAILISTGLLVLMAATVVLIPLALYKSVYWLYTPHAVMIDGASARRARHVSAEAVKGHGLQTLGMALLIGFLTGVPGPVISMALVVFGGLSLDSGEVISAVIFAVVYPLSIVASTLYYLNIRGRLAESIDPRELPVLTRIPGAPGTSQAPAGQ
jgi:hypothetical protein